MRARYVIAASAVLTFLAGCTTSAPAGNDGGKDQGTAKSITMWTTEDVQERVEATKAIAAKFEASTGIKVNVVAIAEDQFDQVITTAAAEGKLPDLVAALNPAGVQSLAVNELLDTQTPGEIVKDLGENTFSPGALKLTQDKGRQLAVPSDAWSQLLFYRKDLFAKAGLAAPDSFDKITAAASRLNTGGTAGIALATTPGDGFTQQSFEYFALGNGCQMVDANRKVTLDSPQCVNTFRFYNDLASKYSLKGNQDVDTTRANYFAGKTAMVVWSSFLLDELAGLRNDALPTCPECKADPTFLAKNTGVIGPVSGPDGQPAQFGQVVSWAITRDANKPATKKFVEYMMNDGYADWLALAPEGKVPVRKGTADDPQKFVKAWGGLTAGVDKKMPLSSIYSADVINSILSGPDRFDRWGFPQGQGALVGATLGELPVPKAINAMVNGGSPEKAGKDATAAVEEIAKSLK
ncbi:carbohydrate ABC transporter substrate-binding protein, CUT1 family [Micromonospora rhizosphaerae]|uniref:Carbohydrate ABC transporter substrate-binding protein, CUT1 family n=1 Tax=Micromonospora rhizosphaerae TaxID=568872 RepID=A0A1C6T1M3_9ACTN|nr:extracellular solute-binding protein [Micromonospora rhizosphaerae]SCL35668.1 carbohydrate ABC transporter substrate-binding protein, CUT1 family [Micromonospora rhizosphaerae]